MEVSGLLSTAGLPHLGHHCPPLPTQAGHTSPLPEQEPRSGRISSVKLGSSESLGVPGQAALPPVRAVPHRAGGARDELDAGGGELPDPLCQDHGALPCQVEEVKHGQNPSQVPLQSCQPRYISHDLGIYIANV